MDTNLLKTFSSLGKSFLSLDRSQAVQVENK